MQELIDELEEDVLKKLLHSMSSSIACTICQEIMFTPFILNCGHSFCYNCLKEWFKNRQECPLCRAKLKRPPQVNLTLRDIVNGFTTILDSAQVNKSKEMLLKDYENDVSEHNLFHRTFNNLIETTLDRSDGVPRCSRCLWEAHGSSCLNCGATFIDDRESDEGEDLYFSDFEMEEREPAEEDDEDDEDSVGSSFLDDRELNEINDDLEDAYLDVLDDDGEDGVASDHLSSGSQWHGFSDDDSMASSLSGDEEVEYEISEDAIRRIYEDVQSGSEDGSDDTEELGVPRARRGRTIVYSDSDNTDSDD